MLGTALGIIAIIVVIVLIVKFIRFLFLNYILSRILSTVAALVSVVMALIGFNVIGCIIASVLAWCFFIGPIIFDVTYDGTVTYTKVSDTVWEGKANKSGGFFSNVIGAFVVIGILYAAASEEFPAIMVVIPLGILLINLWQTRKIWIPLIQQALNKDSESK